MHYPLIVALLDADLDRLQRARQILTSPLDPLKKEPRKNLAVVLTPELPTLDMVDSLAVPELVPTILKPRKARTERQPRIARKLPKTALEAGALGGLVPPMPVYVAATQLRQEQARREVPAGFRPEDAPLTAEMLSQRWLLGVSS